MATCIDGNAPDTVLQKIMLMGLRKSGKSSIQKVVFEKEVPYNTTFLQSSVATTKLKVANNSFVKFQVWDFPGQIDYTDASTFDARAIFDNCGAVVFVMDTQIAVEEAQRTLLAIICAAHKENPDIVFEVFMHKVDQLTETQKAEFYRKTSRAVTEEVQQRLEGKDVKLFFHTTSIFDHSVFHAFSRVIQRLMPQLPYLESLLDVLNTNSGIEKSFVFDVVSKTYLVADTAPIENFVYEVCTDLIDIAVDTSKIYSPSAQEGHPECTSLPHDAMSHVVTRLSSGFVLYMREVSPMLALVCLIRESSFTDVGIIDHNIEKFKTALKQTFEAAK